MNCRVLVGIVLSFGWATAGQASPALHNPYSEIASRNIFGLRPPPVPAAKPTPPAPPLPNVVLTGISTVLGKKRAFLEITSVAKPQQPAKTQSYVLAEGERDSGIEVMGIDPKTEIVTISNNGTQVALNFEKNGRKSVPTPAPRPLTLPPRPFPFHTVSR